MKTHQKKSEKNTRNTHKQKQRKQPKLQSLDLPFPMTKNPAVSLVQGAVSALRGAVLHSEWSSYSCEYVTMKKGPNQYVTVGT